ncbi:MAG: NYN domain-containing protein [Ruminococcaceae bacterium]|nr:NYN domain-containing protein [Oscillospiraceae bacterium]
MDDNFNKPEEAFPSSKALDYLFKRLIELEARVEYLEAKNAPKTDNTLSAKADSIEKKLDMLIGLLQNAPKSADVEDIGGQVVQNSEQTKPKAKKQVAVFIDGENISNKKAETIIEKVGNRGQIKFARVYGIQNTASDKCWVKTSQEFGIKHIRLVGGSKKNKVDKHMFGEILNEAKKNDHVDTIIIVTNDADFITTIKEVRDMGVRVEIMGLKASLSDKLKKVCNSFMYL